MYQYAAVITRVVDGDTVQADVDLGFHVWLRGAMFRLLGCNAIEHDQPGGAEATANLATLLPAGTPVVLTSVKVDKYGGRYDCSITLPDGRDLVSLLIAGQWAAPWDGTGPKPVPPWPRTGAP